MRVDIKPEVERKGDNEDREHWKQTPTSQALFGQNQLDPTLTCNKIPLWIFLVAWSCGVWGFVGFRLLRIQGVGLRVSGSWWECSPGLLTQDSRAPTNVSKAGLLKMDGCVEFFKDWLRTVLRLGSLGLHAPMTQFSRALWSGSPISIVVSSRVGFIRVPYYFGDSKRDPNLENYPY